MTVFLLWHVREVPDGEEDAKLIGVYSSPELAAQARHRAATLPGFSDHPTGFIVDRHVVDQDHWIEGFVTGTRQQLLRELGGRSEADGKPSEACPTPTWTVWRIDDNGNTFVVREHLTHEEAARLAAEFEARGHKQMYWVELNR
jgi:hypothetical protein